MPETVRSTEQDYAADLMALLAEHAMGGISNLVDIQLITDEVPLHVIPEQHHKTWQTMKEMADEGTPPTLIAMRRRGVKFAHISKEASIADVKRALLESYQSTKYRELSGNVLKWLAAGKTSQEISDSIARALDEALIGGLEPTTSVNFMQWLDDVKHGRIPFLTTGWRGVDSVLGSGLFLSGDKNMTGICAYSGIGKTSFALQICGHVLDQGHSVLYFAGENDTLTISKELARIKMGVPKAAVKANMTTAIEEAMLKGQNWLNEQLWAIWDKHFDVDVVRGMLSRRAAWLRDRHPGKHLLVVVDNLDHIINVGGERDWLELEQSAKKLYNAGQRTQSHVLALLQAKPVSYEQGRPPRMNETARSNLVVSHLTNFMGLYRPLTEEDELDDKRNRVRVSIPKARGGSGGDVRMIVNPNVGTWREVGS